MENVSTRLVLFFGYDQFVSGWLTYEQKSFLVNPLSNNYYQHHNRNIHHTMSIVVLNSADEQLKTEKQYIISHFIEMNKKKSIHQPILLMSPSTFELINPIPKAEATGQVICIRHQYVPYQHFNP